MPAGQQAEDVGSQAAPQVPLGHDNHPPALGRGIEARPQAHLLEQHSIDVVEHQQIQVVLLRQALHGHGRPDAGQEFLLVHVGLDRVAGGDVRLHRLGLRRGDQVDFVAQLRNGIEVQLRAHLAEDVRRVDVGAPHGFVIAGQQADARILQQRTRPGRVAEGAGALQHLRPGAQAGFQHRTAVVGVVAAGFLGAHQAAAAQIFGELVVVVGILEVDFLPHAVGKEHRHRRHVPQKANPGIVLRPGEVQRQHKVHLVRHKGVHGALHILGIPHDAGKGHVKIHGAVPDHPGGLRLLALPVASPGRALANVRKALRR